MALKLSRAWKTLVPSWDGNDQLPRGEQVRLQYRTLTVEDVFRAQEEVDVDLLQAQTITQPSTSQRQYWKFMRYLLERYTQEWEGVEVDGKALATGAEVAEAAGMSSMGLFGEIVGRIVSESTGTEDEAKNSDGQSAPESSGSATTASAASPNSSEMPATAA